MTDIPITQEDLDPFEAACPEGYSDAERELLWKGWKLAVACSVNGLDVLRNGYQSSIMLSDSKSARITMHYATRAQAGTAHELLCEIIDSHPTPPADTQRRRIVAGCDMDLRDLALMFAGSQETGQPVTLSASACSILLRAMMTGTENE